MTNKNQNFTSRIVNDSRMVTHNSARKGKCKLQETQTQVKIIYQKYKAIEKILPLRKLKVCVEANKERKEVVAVEKIEKCKQGEYRKWLDIRVCGWFSACHHIFIVCDKALGNIFHYTLHLFFSFLLFYLNFMNFDIILT